jgi:mRNA-degrading endonuclease toxin of MazEF toxin-antitoxin module
MNDLNQGDIVLVDFSYSNQHQSKLRPALIISNSANNRISRDVVVMKITKTSQTSGVSVFPMKIWLADHLPIPVSCR